jgi:hypothetical protein
LVKTRRLQKLNMLQKLTEYSIDRIPGALRVQGSEKVLHFLVLGLCVLAVILSFLLQHDGQKLQLYGTGWPLHCALYQTFGIKCALCGLTRSFCSMARGEIFSALRFHPLGPAIFVFVCLQIPYRIYALCSGVTKREKLKRAGVYSAFGLAVALLINWFIYLGGLVL